MRRAIEVRLDGRPRVAGPSSCEGEKPPGWVTASTTLHFDTRADNILIAGDRLFVLDWPSARVGAAFVDWLIIASSVAMQGGPAPDDFMARFDLSGVSRENFDAILCSVAGYFVVRALDPASPGLPTLPAFQAAQGEVALAWLKKRLALS